MEKVRSFFREWGYVLFFLGLSLGAFGFVAYGVIRTQKGPANTGVVAGSYREGQQIELVRLYDSRAWNVYRFDDWEKNVTCWIYDGYNEAGMACLSSIALEGGRE